MRFNFAPAVVFVLGTLVSMVLVAWITWIATTSHWLGLTLDAQGDTVVVTAVDARGGLAQDLGGRELLAIAIPGQDPVTITPFDLIEEPDALGDAGLVREFYARQDVLHQTLAHGPVILTVADANGPRDIAAQTAPARPLAGLPPKFWVQMFVGLFGLVIGLWVMCLRPRDGAARMVMLTGIGLALSAWAAAVYSSRELALSAEAFSLANRINTTGAMTFGIGMVTLFLIYPRRIVPRFAVALPGLLIGSAVALIQLHNWPQHLVEIPLMIAVIMLVLIGAIVAQAVVNRRDVKARAMLGWLGLFVAIGAGGFVLTAIVPLLFGQEILLEQSTAFLSFLLIYTGIALGVARYRLFDLSTWSFEILFYGMGVALLLLLDAVLIFVVSVDRMPAFGIALALVAMIYLPLRNQIWNRMRRNTDMPPDTLFTRITEIAHAQTPQAKISMLHALWEDLFAPLSIEDLPVMPEVDSALVDSGGALHLAPVFGLPALRLNWRGRGSRLFSSRDLQRAVSINALIDSSLRQNQTYLEAVTTERNRINRDMHDNLGILLVSALHTPAAKRKDTLIRQTLTDLREIIANEGQTRQQLPSLIADLRSEISDHLEAAGIGFVWRYEPLPDVDISAQGVHVSRAFFRETVQNIIRHAQANTVTFDIALSGGTLSATIADDGKGFDPEQERTGSGVRNMATRLTNANGQYNCKSGTGGTTVSMTLPLEATVKEAAE